MIIEKRELLDMCIWLLVGFYVLFAHWIWYGRGIQESLIIFLMMIAIAKRYRIRNRNPLVRIIAIALCISICYITGAAESRLYLISDLKSMGGGLLSVVYLFSFYTSNSARCIRYIEKACDLLMKYMWVNSLIMLLQYKIPYFLMNREAVSSVDNAAYFDQITGFIGINGTTRWNVLACVVSIHMLSKATRKQDKKQYYSYAFIVLSAIISMLNSARAFFIMLPMFLLVYFFVIKDTRLSGKTKYIFTGAVIIMVGVIVYFTNGYVNAFINELIMDKFAIYMSRDLAYMVGANDDRAVAVNYAIKYGGWFGRGIGTIPMHYADSEVRYLGLNSTSSYIYMIGISGYLLYTLYWAIQSVKSNCLKKCVFQSIVLLAVWLITSYLLPLYSSITLMFCMGIIMLIYANEYDIQSS